MRPVRCEFFGNKDPLVIVDREAIADPGGFPLRGSFYCDDCEMVFPGGVNGACPYCGSRSVMPLTRAVVPLSAIKTV